MRDSLILPLAAIPTRHRARSFFARASTPARCRRPAMLRPRDQRVRMIGSGYRAVIDGKPAACEPVADGRAVAGGARPPGPAGDHQNRLAAGRRAVHGPRACAGWSSKRTRRWNPDSIGSASPSRRGTCAASGTSCATSRSARPRRNRSNRALKNAAPNVERKTQNEEIRRNSTFYILRFTFRLRSSAAC